MQERLLNIKEETSVSQVVLVRQQEENSVEEIYH